MTAPFELAALLGALRGLTEFWPISSSGHLALAQTLFNLGDAERSLSSILRLGTLLATVYFFRKRLLRLFAELWLVLTRAKGAAYEPARTQDVMFIAIACAPTAVLGLLLHDSARAWAEEPLAVGFGFLLTGLLLLSSLWAGSAKVPSPNVWAALIVGVAQGLAILPGISRTAATIVTALWFGVRPERAFELSMLLGIPTVAGAILLDLTQDTSHDAGVFPVLLGLIVAASLGFAALHVLRRAVTQRQLAWFALWVLPLALATLAMARAWPGGADGG
jgi:undecaprenyl-diphosphatase